MKMKLIIQTLFLVMLWITVVFAAEEKPILIEVNGEAVGSDLDSPREVCERAKIEAQRSALEQAVGSFIRSHTIVSNSQLAEDLIYARVRGRIERFEVLGQERLAVSNGCRVKIRCLVKPVYPQAADFIQVKAALSRTELREGDEVSVQYQMDRDSYVYLFVVAADNSVTQLLPNSEQLNNRVLARQMYQFPPLGTSARLKAALLPGNKAGGAVERVKVIATRHKEPLLERGFQEGFAVYDAKGTGLMSDLLKRLNQLEPADWGEATLEYRILPR